MSTHASIWTPRHTNKLWPRPSGKKYVKPPIVFPYVAPPPPPSRKKPPAQQALAVPADQLMSIAEQLRAEAEELSKDQPAPSVRIQLGLLLLTREDYIKKLLKDWDTKNKGEFLKGEFRLNLRSTGINASSAEADELFDSWDE